MFKLEFPAKRLLVTALSLGSILPHAHAAPAPVKPVESHEELTALAWVQSSVEAKVAARQAYRLAARQLDLALRDKSWSAALEQKAPFKQLPPAIILDLDETVLDNSPYFARIARDHTVYSDAGWNRWSAQGAATAIEGAVPFLQYAARKGVQIFYISNRTSAEEKTTRDNLARLGCPLQTNGDHVLLYGEHGWKSDKTPRRRLVVQKYRVLLLLGDDLNDFVSARSITLVQRAALYRKYLNNWGERWILLSNPMYGSWEDAINGFDDSLSHQEMIRRKYGVLQYREPVTASLTPSNR